MKCLGREGDEGREVYWDTWWSTRLGWSELDLPTNIRTSMHGKRYVCRNHKDGYWFEQVPR